MRARLWMVVICLAVASTALGQATIGTTASNVDTFWSGDQVYGHCAAGHFWIAYYDGVEPRLYSSPDAVTWTQQPQLFTTFSPTTNAGWAVHFQGTDVIAAGYNAGDTVRYYRNGTLNGDGTVTWTGVETTMGFSGASWNELNVRIVNNKPVLWRVGTGGNQRGRFRIGTQLTSPVWADTTGDPPAVATASGGGYSEGAIFPVGGSDPDDLIVLRFTTNFSYIAGRHNLISVKYDASLDPDPYEAAWYNVSTLGGGLIESATTDVFNIDDDSIHEKTATVMDVSGNIHAVYVNRNIELVHYMKTPGFNDNWSRISTNVAGFTDIRKVALGSDTSGVYVFYAKPDSRIYWRRFDGSTWGVENIVKNTTTFLAIPPAPIKLGLNCGMGVAWVEETGATDTVLFSLVGGGANCTPLTTSETSSTLTVTGAGAFEMTFDTVAGGSVKTFYDLGEDPSKSNDLVGGVGATPQGLHTMGMQVAGSFYNSAENDSGATLHLLEATPTRVRVRSHGYLEDAGPNLVLGGVQVNGSYSVYPSGKMALHWDRRVMKTINFDTEYVENFLHWTNGVPPLDGWSIFRQAGGGTGAPGTDDFILAQIEASGARTDFLSILSKDWTLANGYDGEADLISWAFNAGPERVNPDWIDTTAGIHTPSGALNWSAETWDQLTYFTQKGLVNEGDVNVTGRSADYRSPDGLAGTKGGPWLDASESTGGGDDFNEAEGVYSLTFDPTPTTGGLTFDIDGGTITRYSPAFKIRQWRSFQDPQVTLEGIVLTNGIDFEADVKPISRAQFAGELTWHSTFEDSAAVMTPDVGSGGTGNNGNDFPLARFGRGARFDVDGEYAVIPAAGNFDPNQGAIEFWFQPNYDYGANYGDLADDFGLFGYYIDANNYFHAHHEPYDLATGVNNGVEFQAASGGVMTSVTLGAGPSFPEYWRAEEWVHLRFVWNVGASRFEIYVNGKLEGSAAYTAAPPLPGDDNFYIAERNRNLVLDNNAEGTIDEFRIYNAPDAPSALAHGGLRTDARESLASVSRNAALPFVIPDGNGRGEYFYLGSDSEFRGLNVSLATFGVGAVDLQWEYWNGTQWTDLEGGFSFVDNTNHFTQGGSIHWNDPGDWAVYSVNGEPELYYVRASLASGAYTTTPVEASIKTDILIFQHCANISSDARTFDFALPVPTAVELEHFDAAGVDGAVELEWRTATELDNLGFHLYRAGSTEGPYERVTSRPIPGLGSSPAGATYRFRDEGLANGATYYYELEDIDTSAVTTRHGPIAATPSPELAPTEDGDETRIEVGEPARTEVRVIRRNERRVVLELVTTGFEAIPGDDGAVRLSIPGFDEAASLAVPVKSYVVNAVPGRKVRIASVRARGLMSFAGLRPESASSFEPVAERNGTIRARRRRRGANARAASDSDPWARIADVGYQGDVKKARVVLAPLRWDAARGELVLARRLRVVIAFDGREAPARRKAPADGVVARLATREAGLYAVDFQDVFGARRRAYRHLKLTRAGEEVPFHIEPSGRGFARGTTLYFVSEGASANPYGDEAVYELALESGRRMEVVSRRPGGAELASVRVTDRQEQNRYYQAGLVDVEDIWLWDLLLAPDTKSYPFRVEALVAGAGSMTVALQGASDADTAEDHHVRLRVNGMALGDARWDGKKRRLLEIELPDGALHDGDNELAIENVGDTDAPSSMVMLDWFEWSYDRSPEGAFRGTWTSAGTASVTGVSGEPKLIADGRWLADFEHASDTVRFRVEAGEEVLVSSDPLRAEVRPARRSSLLKRTRRAEWLVIGPKELLGEAKPLLKLRRRQGLRAASASLEEIYDVFGGGETTPEAIRELIRYVYHERAKRTRLRYVVLLGDGTYDFKDYMGTGVRNQVPPFVVRTSYLWTASDPAYAAVNGDDLIPDVAIGRLPAKTPDEARRMVAKILAFESSAEVEPAPIVLVTDNPDDAGNFERNADQLIETVLAGKTTTMIRLSELGAGGVRSEVKAALNDGVSILSYIGHGGIHLWASENAFNTGDVAALEPRARQPLLLTMNCLNGYFHFPFFDSLAEAMVKADGRGAVAAFSPTGLSLDAEAHLFHIALLEEILGGGHARLGDAVLRAQERYADSGAFPELLSIYHLFGDPALSLR